MTIDKKEDPRAIRSKRLIKEAVKDLLIENPDITKLTVRSISSRAGLNRATFYLHFLDIDDLLKQMVYDVFDDLSYNMSPVFQIGNIHHQEQFIAFLDYFYKHRKFLPVLMEGPGFQKKLHMILRESIAIVGNEHPVKTSDVTLSSDILAASILGIIKWWLKDGIHFSSEYIANQVNELYGNLHT